MTAFAQRYVPEEILENGHPPAGQAAGDPLSLMGLNSGSDSDAVALASSGLPTTVIEGLARSLGISRRDLLAASAIAPATLTRRRNAAGGLSPAESDRVYRIADCLGDAIRLFEGDWSMASISDARLPPGQGAVGGDRARWQRGQGLRGPME
jgi:hypothetical protein